MVINKTVSVLGLAVLFLVFAVNFGSAFSGDGNGSLINPFNITNCTQLDEVRNNLIANYSLIADINFSATGCTQYRTGAGWIPIGNASYPDGLNLVANAFLGTFSGNNKNISNLLIFNSSLRFVGLFGVSINASNYGKFYNISLLNVNVTGHEGTGALVGLGGESGVGSIINNSHVTGTITGSNYYTGGLVGKGQYMNIAYSDANVTVIGGSQSAAGGLVGEASYATILFSNSSGYVRSNSDSIGGLVGGAGVVKINNSYSTAMVNGSYNVGGLVGSGVSSVIYNSYATGKVTGTEFNVGGLIGNAENANITYAYATGDVRAGKDGLDVSYVGGFAGFADGATFSNVYSAGNVSGTGSTGIGGLIGHGVLTVPGSNYWDINTSHQTTSANGTGLTTLEMKNVNIFNIWSIASVNFGATNTGFIWNIVNTSTYPFLSWEAARTNPDVTAPLLLTISSTHTTSRATINWTTNEPANSSVKYGTNLSLSSVPINDVNFNNNYTLITDLSANTLYYYNLTVCDSAGNCATNGTYNFTTDALADNTTDNSGGSSSGGGGGGGGGGGADTGLWTLTYSTLADIEFRVGHVREFANRSRIGFKIGNDTHYLGVIGINNASNTATLNISSTPQIKTLSVGEEWKVDADGNGIYDLIVKLNNVSSVKANISMMAIVETVPVIASVANNAANNGTNVSQERNDDLTKSFSSVGKIILVVVILLIIAVIVWFVYLRGKFREDKINKSVRYVGKNDR
jgi:hypothetical protein